MVFLKKKKHLSNEITGGEFTWEESELGPLSGSTWA